MHDIAEGCKNSSIVLKQQLKSHTPKLHMFDKKVTYMYPTSIVPAAWVNELKLSCTIVNKKPDGI